MIQHADVIREATLYICYKWCLDPALEAKLKSESFSRHCDYYHEIHDNSQNDNVLKSFPMWREAQYLIIVSLWITL